SRSNSAATFANGSDANSIGPACSASTIDGPSAGMIRKYLRSDASPVSGTTRGLPPASPVSARKRVMRSRRGSDTSATWTSVAGFQPQRRGARSDQHPAPVFGAGRHHHAVGDDALVDHRAGFDAHILPQNRVGDAG